MVRAPVYNSQQNSEHTGLCERAGPCSNRQSSQSSAVAARHIKYGATVSLVPPWVHSHGASTQGEPAAHANLDNGKDPPTANIVPNALG